MQKQRAWIKTFCQMRVSASSPMYCGVPLVLLYSSPCWNRWARPKSMSLMMGFGESLSDSMMFSGWNERIMLLWWKHVGEQFCSVLNHPQCADKSWTDTLRSKWAMFLLCMNLSPSRICFMNSIASLSNRFSFSAMKSNSSPPLTLTFQIKVCVSIKCFSYFDSPFSLGTSYQKPNRTIGQQSVPVPCGRLL